MVLNHLLDLVQCIPVAWGILKLESAFRDYQDNPFNPLYAERARETAIKLRGQVDRTRRSMRDLTSWRGQFSRPLLRSCCDKAESAVEAVLMEL